MSIIDEKEETMSLRMGTVVGHKIMVGQVIWSIQTKESTSVANIIRTDSLWKRKTAPNMNFLTSIEILFPW